ncbi:lateral signaling target protein 2 homolog isoform X2 [Lucilia sericata]|uniref:lateral signaling target protein 2 homolog isoform X2 n=1 Tax=Lucilia sericata TaxID=13632 RepID=UPI0018A82BDD|nr:lateral signaling target protein 2 homolog isoform X2 [Lucilia sericata]
MNYSAKKRKKEKELELKLDFEGHDDCGKEEIQTGKENNIVMPTDEEDEQQQLAKQMNDTAAPLQLPEQNKRKTTIQMASTEDSTKRTNFSTTTTASALTCEPADNTSAGKWKNCQCNLQSDQHLKENQKQQEHHHHHNHHDYEPLYLHQPKATCKQSNIPPSPPTPPANVITSLATVYICLGILTWL